MFLAIYHIIYIFAIFISAGQAEKNFAGANLAMWLCLGKFDSLSDNFHLEHMTLQKLLYIKFAPNVFGTLFYYSSTERLRWEWFSFIYLFFFWRTAILRACFHSFLVIKKY